jgi:hypothetical protein
MQKTFPLEVYDTKVHFELVDHCNNRWKKLMRKYKIRFTDDECEYLGLFFKANHTYHILIDKNNVTYNTICHEIHHASCMISRDRHIDNEEATAWICGYLSQVIFGFLNKNNVTISNAC